MAAPFLGNWGVEGRDAGWISSDWPLPRSRILPTRSRSRVRHVAIASSALNPTFVGLVSATLPAGRAENNYAGGEHLLSACPLPPHSKLHKRQKVASGVEQLDETTAGWCSQTPDPAATGPKKRPARATSVRLPRAGRFLSSSRTQCLQCELSANSCSRGC